MGVIHIVPAAGTLSVADTDRGGLHENGALPSPGGRGRGLSVALCEISYDDPLKSPLLFRSTPF